MNKSQLRRLALDYAHGRLDREDYRARRGRLLDDIVKGETRIERETPVIDVDVTQPSAFVPATPRAPGAEAAAAAEPLARATLSPLHMGVGAGLLALLVAAGVWLFAGGDPPPPPKPVVTTAPAPAVSPARALVERFVAEKDFSERSLAAFERSWSALASADIEEARGAPWFRRLVTIVVQEVKTQKALADLDGTGAAVQKARRLFEFGRFLDISEGLLPEVSAAPLLPQPPVSETGVTTGAAVIEPATSATPAPAPTVETGVLPAAVAPPTPQLPASPAPASTMAATTRLNGREWLMRQPRNAYTLQLFALNHLEKIEGLISRHPELDLHLVDYAPQEPRYRVLYGSYADLEQARAAHTMLPEDVRRAQPEAFARLVGEMLTGDTRVVAAAPPASSSWLRQQPAARFTLQLFASNSRENAERVVRRFPDLALALHESADERSRYRVLYGSFSSVEEARRAFNSLPAGLAEDAGLPLVKSIGEMQLSEASPAVN